MRSLQFLAFLVGVISVLFLQCTNQLLKENRDFGISASELRGKIDSNESFLLLDVRSAKEYYVGHLKKAKLFPAADIFSNVKQLPVDDEIVLYCSDGTRSLLVTKHLKSYGYSNVRRLNGGIKAWSWKLVK